MSSDLSKIYFVNAMTATLSDVKPRAALADRLQGYALRSVVTPVGTVAYRESGAAAGAVSHVLLHGIGSASASWLMQLEAAAGDDKVRLLAWDAPGYGGSDALPMDEPVAADYAQRLWAWLDAIGASTAEPFTLVGHSLGCLMAASAARKGAHRIKNLVLLSPAQGYARATAAERAQKLNERLDNLAKLGPVGMAQRRGAAMLSPNATAGQVAFVQNTMAQIHPAGYTQAVRLLVGGDLLTDLSALTCPVAIASGSADTVTPPAGCIAAAAQVGAPYTSIAGAGHACAVEAPDEVSRLIGLATTIDRAATP